MNRTEEEQRIARQWTLFPSFSVTGRVLREHGSRVYCKILWQHMRRWYHLQHCWRGRHRWTTQWNLDCAEAYGWTAARVCHDCGTVAYEIPDELIPLFFSCPQPPPKP